MEAITFITDWVKWVLILIPFGAGAMVTYQATRKSLSDDEETVSDANKKIKKTIMGAIIAISMGSTIEIIKSFYLVNGALESMTPSPVSSGNTNLIIEIILNFFK